MRRTALPASLALAGIFAATLAFAQQPQTVRLRGVIEKADGHTVLAKSAKGDELKLNLADKVLVVAVVKASMADIKEGDFIGSGAMRSPTARRRRSKSTSSPSPCAAPAKDFGRGTVLPTAR